MSRCWYELPPRATLGILNACFALSSSSEVSILRKMCEAVFCFFILLISNKNKINLCLHNTGLYLFIILCLVLSYSQRDNEGEVSEHPGEAREVSSRRIPNKILICRFFPRTCPGKTADFAFNTRKTRRWFSHRRKIVYTFLPNCLRRATLLIAPYLF